MDRGRDYCFHQFGAGSFGDGEGRWCRRCVATRGGRNQTRLSFPFPQFYPPCVGRRHDSLLARDGWMDGCVSVIHYCKYPPLQNKAVIFTTFTRARIWYLVGEKRKVAMRMNMEESSCAICYTLKTSAKFLAGDWLGNSQMFQLSHRPAAVPGSP